MSGIPSAFHGAAHVYASSSSSTQCQDASQRPPLRPEQDAMIPGSLRKRKARMQQGAEEAKGGGGGFEDDAGAARLDAQRVLKSARTKDWR